MNIDEVVICSGCGWTGTVETLNRGDCPNCGQENNLEPNRLLTLSEMLEDDEEYGRVRMDLFLKALFKWLSYPDGKSEWAKEEVI